MQNPSAERLGVQLGLAMEMVDDGEISGVFLFIRPSKGGKLQSVLFHLNNEIQKDIEDTLRKHFDIDTTEESRVSRR